MSGPVPDIQTYTVRHLKYLARHGDKDARAELQRRMREAVAADERRQAEAEGNGESRASRSWSSSN